MASGAVLLAIEVQYADSGGYSLHDHSCVGGIRVRQGGTGGQGNQVAWMLPRQVELALEVLLGDLDIAQRHVGSAMAEQFHQCGQADSGAEHAGRIGVPQHVGRYLFIVQC